MGSASVPVPIPLPSTPSSVRRNNRIEACLQQSTATAKAYATAQNRPHTKSKFYCLCGNPLSCIVVEIHHRGFLNKQGAKVTSWRRRFFVAPSVTESVLLYYKTTDIKSGPQGCIVLSAAQVSCVIHVVRMFVNGLNCQITMDDGQITIVAPVSFTVTTHGVDCLKNRIFHLRASPGELSVWMDVLHGLSMLYSHMTMDGSSSLTSSLNNDSVDSLVSSQKLFHSSDHHDDSSSSDGNHDVLTLSVIAWLREAIGVRDWATIQEARAVLVTHTTVCHSASVLKASAVCVHELAGLKTSTVSTHPVDKLMVRCVCHRFWYCV
jgi:hypothetical protein